jgi:hypothetical protein
MASDGFQFVHNGDHLYVYYKHKWLQTVKKRNNMYVLPGFRLLPEESDDDQEQTHLELSAEDVELAKHHGRDKNGMFKNHKNFVKMRNKINDQEQKHQKMFDTITKKLGDETFIAQASSATTFGDESNNSTSSNNAT